VIRRPNFLRFAARKCDLAFIDAGQYFCHLVTKENPVQNIYKGLLGEKNAPKLPDF
jgi:hypothetical protein